MIILEKLCETASSFLHMHIANDGKWKAGPLLPQSKQAQKPSSTQQISTKKSQEEVSTEGN